MTNCTLLLEQQHVMDNGDKMRNTLQNKITNAVKDSSFDAIFLSGYDNLHYVIGCDFLMSVYRSDQPSLLLLVKHRAPVLVCPCEWVSAILAAGEIANVIGYQTGKDNSHNLVETVVNLLIGFGCNLKKIGLDLCYTSTNLYNELGKHFTKSEIVSCDEWIETLRVIKTPEEIEILKDLAYRTDHGINGAIHHVTVDRRTTRLTLAEELRVHTVERGVDIVGYHGCTTVIAGNETKKYFGEPPKFGYSIPEDLHPGDMVRLSAFTSMDGYWSDANRTMVMGEMHEEQEKHYQMLVRLREKAVCSIRAGVKASTVYKKIKTMAEEEKIPLISNLNLGHGIGSSPFEPPFINAGDDSQLKENMVLVINIAIKAADDEIWIGKDTVLVTRDGCEIVGWYKDWREPYIPIASI